MVSGRWFVRLTTRSPKDAGTTSTARLNSQLAHYMSSIPAAHRDDEVWTTNAKLQAVFTVTWDCLAVTTAAAAVDLLLSSERVFCDLLAAVEAAEMYNVEVCVFVCVGVRGCGHAQSFVALHCWLPQSVSFSLCRSWGVA